ncbi:MAG: ribonuclease D, partial [Gammaproteobacteria bacterium]|nr:ribonuclease D [Gammaproteobacteria bacterium]
MLSSSFVITGQPHLQFIQDADALSAFCAAIQDVDCIAVDTEFVRERTYYPRLCLVQVASRDHLACIDTLAIDDLQPLLALMSDATITKVMHAARQDLEILLLAGEAVPGPVFDTQVAGDLCGLGNQLGLAAITAELIGVEVDKTHSRADWSRRPLNDTLLEYAANDVRHLIEIYDLLRQRLAELDRVDWQLEECERLAAVDLYRVEPDQAWKKVRGINRLPAPAYHVARELARWRESRAMDRDRPRNWVLR